MPKMSEWGVEVINPAKVFASIDKDGGGQLLFDEFSGWGIQRGMDMLDDGEEEGEDTLAKQHVGSAAVASKAVKAKAAAAKAAKTAPAKTAATGPPPWIKLVKKLPAGRSEADKAKRKKLFRTFDPNGNGYLSLAEVDRGLIITFQLDGGSEFATKRCKPAILRAFQAAKTSSGTTTGHAGDYVTKGEFRILLVYLQRYFELLAVFDEVDTGNDRRVDLSEFKKALPKLSEWGVEVADPATYFASIDKNGGGQLLFDEFADWGLKRGLDVLEEHELKVVMRKASQAAPSAAPPPRAGRKPTDKPADKPAEYVQRKPAVPLPKDRAPRMKYDVQIEPVENTPNTPFQQYMKASRRYADAVAKLVKLA